MRGGFSRSPRARSAWRSLEGLGLSFRRTVRAAPWSDAEDASRDGVPRDAADDASARVSRASSRLATRRRWLRDDPPGVRCTRAVLDGETAAGASDTGLEAAREAQAARLHRFYVDEPLPESGGTVYLDRDESRHAVRALRLKPGDALEVCDGRGGVMTAELVGMEGDGGRDAGVAAVASVGEVRRALSRGRDGTSSPRAEDSREDAPIGSWRSAPSSAPHRSYRSSPSAHRPSVAPSVTRATKKNTAGGRVRVRPRDAATSGRRRRRRRRQNRTRGAVGARRGGGE